MIKCYVCSHEDENDKAQCPDCNSVIASMELTNDALHSLKRMAKDGYFDKTGVKIEGGWIVPVDRKDVIRINKFMEVEGIDCYSEVVKKLSSFALAEIAKGIR